MAAFPVKELRRNRLPAGAVAATLVVFWVAATGVCGRVQKQVVMFHQYPVRVDVDLEARTAIVSPPDSIPGLGKSRTFYDYNTRYIAYKDYRAKQCHLERMSEDEKLPGAEDESAEQKEESPEGSEEREAERRLHRQLGLLGPTQHNRNRQKRAPQSKVNPSMRGRPKTLYVTETVLSKYEVLRMAGRRISHFCRGFPATLLVQRPPNPAPKMQPPSRIPWLSENELPGEGRTDHEEHRLLLDAALVKARLAELELQTLDSSDEENSQARANTNKASRSKRQAAANGGSGNPWYWPRKYRGQTQSQFVSFGGGEGKGDGSAQAESRPDGTTTLVRGVNGMGQSQSQSSVGDGCEGCYPGGAGYTGGAYPGGGQYGPWQTGYGTGGRVTPGGAIAGQTGVDGAGAGRGAAVGPTAGRGYGPGTPGYARPTAGGPGYDGAPGMSQGQFVRPGSLAQRPGATGPGSPGYGGIPGVAPGRGLGGRGYGKDGSGLAAGGPGYDRPTTTHSVQPGGPGYVSPTGTGGYGTTGAGRGNGYRGTGVGPTGGGAVSRPQNGGVYRPSYVGPSPSSQLGGPGYGQGGLVHRPSVSSGHISPGDGGRGIGGAPGSHVGYPSASGHQVTDGITSGHGGQVPGYHKPGAHDGQHLAPGMIQRPIAGTHDYGAPGYGVLPGEGDGRHAPGGGRTPSGVPGGRIPSGHGVSGHGLYGPGGGHGTHIPGQVVNGYGTYPSGGGVPGRGIHDGIGQHVPSGTGVSGGHGPVHGGHVGGVPGGHVAGVHGGHLVPGGHVGTPGGPVRGPGGHIGVVPGGHIGGVPGGHVGGPGSHIGGLPGSHVGGPGSHIGGVPGGHVGVPGGHIGAPGGHIGAPGGHIGAPGGHIGAPGGHIGAPGGHIGAPGGHIGAPGGHIGVPGGHVEGMPGGQVGYPGGPHGVGGHPGGYGRYPTGHGQTATGGDGRIRGPGAIGPDGATPEHLVPESMRAPGGVGGRYPGQVTPGVGGVGGQRPDGGIVGADQYGRPGGAVYPGGQRPGYGVDGQYGGPGYYDGQAYPLTRPGVGGRGQAGVGDAGESQAQSSVTQDDKEIKAGASSQGRLGDGKAQAQVSGTYSGTGAFSAQAQTSDGGRSAQSQVTGNKDGGSSSAQGNGGSGQSQTQVQLSSTNGATKAEAQSGGWQHGSNTQVQAGENGGMADAQSSGPGTTSSQAQVGFKPYRGNGSVQRTPFRGGGTASAQSSSYSGQSQSQVQGAYRYGVSFTGAAQAGSGARGSRGAGSGSSTNSSHRFERDDHAALSPDSFKLTPLKNFRETSSIGSQDGIKTSESSDSKTNGNGGMRHQTGLGHSSMQGSHQVPSNIHQVGQTGSNGHTHTSGNHGIHKPHMPMDNQMGRHVPNGHSHFNGNDHGMQGSHQELPSNGHQVTHNSHSKMPQQNGNVSPHSPDTGTEGTLDGQRGPRTIHSSNGNRQPDNEYPHFGDNRMPAGSKPMSHGSMQGGEISREISHQDGRQSVFKTEAPRQSQAVFLSPMSNEDVHITQASDGGGIPAQSVYQPGQVVPGSSGYVIPDGFRGRVVGDSSRSIAGDETLAVASPNNGNSQSQTVVLTPGSGKVNYTRIVRPPHGQPVIPAYDDYGQNQGMEEESEVPTRRTGQRSHSYMGSDVYTRGDQHVYSRNKVHTRSGGESIPPSSHKTEDEYDEDDDEETEEDDDKTEEEAVPPPSSPSPIPNRFVSVTKSVSGQLNPIGVQQGSSGRQFLNGNRGTDGGKFSSTYYTKTSTCGYFTFSCNVVFGSNGRAKICTPRPPTNPDGSPCCC